MKRYLINFIEHNYNVYSLYSNTIHIVHALGSEWKLTGMLFDWNKSSMNDDNSSFRLALKI